MLLQSGHAAYIRWCSDSWDGGGIVLLKADDNSHMVVIRLVITEVWSESAVTKMHVLCMCRALSWAHYMRRSLALRTLFFIVDCGIAHFLCAIRLFDVRASSSSARLPVPNLISVAPSIVELAHGEKLCTQSINHSPSLFDVPGAKIYYA